MPAGNLNVAFGAVVGLLVCTAMAILLNVDRAPLQQGLFGLNGILVGVAVPIVLANHLMMWGYLIIGAAVSTVVTLAIAKVVRLWGVPGSTAPFVFTTWLLLLGPTHLRMFRLLRWGHQSCLLQRPLAVCPLGPTS